MRPGRGAPRRDPDAIQKQARAEPCIVNSFVAAIVADEPSGGVGSALAWLSDAYGTKIGYSRFADWRIGTNHAPRRALMLMIQRAAKYVLLQAGVTATVLRGVDIEEFGAVMAGADGSTPAVRQWLLRTYLDIDGATPKGVDWVWAAAALSVAKSAPLR